MTNELWKVIPNTDNTYFISSYGRVYSIKRNKFLKLTLHKRGYLQVGIYIGGKLKMPLVHRLVAQAFIHQPSKEQNTVNHIDGNKTNNHTSNLEWVTQQENVDHAFKRGLHNKPRKPVLCIELNTIFKSAYEAGNHLGINQSNICKVCNGKARSIGGYTWRYIDEGGI